MKAKSTNPALPFLLCTCLVSSAALADNLLGAYIGAGGGTARVRADQAILGDTNYVSSFDQRHAAWKVIAGIRPLSPLSAELEYTDFGNPGSGGMHGPFGGLTRVDEKAVTLLGLGHLPLPVRLLDVYGKLGVARLRTASTSVGPVPFCPIGFACIQATDSQSNWSTHVAFGAGIQRKLDHLAIRAEYERIGSDGDGPDLLSLGVTWTF